MLNKTKMFLAAALLASFPAGSLWADNNSAADAVAHPETTYHEHEVKSDSQDVQELSQKKAEVKARMDQAKKDYEKSLQTNGAQSDVTKEAKKRLDDARKDYKKLAMKTNDASKELQKDKQELQQDKQELQQKAAQ